MNRRLFLSILSLDSYNRGYDPRIKGLSVSGSIGTATIDRDSSILGNINGVRADQADSFYAIAYNWNGQKVISYRGTDDIRKDFWSYGTGAGNPLDLLAENYNATVGLTHS